MKKRLLQIALVLGTILISASSFAQKNKGAQTAPESSDAQIIKDAAQYFKVNNYAAAFPLYSQILSLHPRDFTYNYRFGVCQLFMNEDPEKAIFSLEYASKYAKMDVMVFYYLGKAYHQSYKFDEAIACFEKFKNRASSSQLKSSDVEMLIAMCYNAKQLMSSISDLYVLQKKDVNRAGFFRSYELDDIGGMLLAKSSDFQTPLDKKLEDENALMYIPKDRSFIYFASYGKDEKNGKDIYRVKRGEDGKWSVPENLGDIVNSKYDEDYPYVSMDGKTIYFSSKGHNSMGGFDVFRSTWDSINSKWTKPENLDFAINTPYDDYLFIPDINERNAFFASTRTASFNMTSLYKVRIDRRPRQKEAIVVAAEYTQSYANNDTVKKEEVIKVIKQKAKLPVNASEERFARYDAPEEPQTAIATIDVNKVASANNQEENKYKKTYVFEAKDNEYPEIQITEKSSNQDIINSSKIETLKLQNELDELSYKSKAANVVVADVNSEIQDKIAESLKYKTQADTIQDASKKREWIMHADSLRNEVVELKKESDISKNIAQLLTKKKEQKHAELNQSSKFVKDLEAALNSKSTKDAIAIIDEYNKQADVQSYDDTQIMGQMSPNQGDYSTAKAEADKLETVTTKLKDDADEIARSIENIDKDINNTRKKDTKEALVSQKNNLKTEQDEVLAKYSIAKQKSDVAIKQADSVKSEIALVQNVFDNISSTADSNFRVDNKKNPKPTVEQQMQKLGITYSSPAKPTSPIVEKATEPVNTSEGIQMSANKNVESLKKQYENFNDQYLTSATLARTKANEAQQLSNDADQSSGDQTEKRKKAKELSESAVASNAVSEYYKAKSDEAKKMLEDAQDLKIEIARKIASNDLKNAKNLLFEQEDIIQFNQDKLNSTQSIDEIVKNAASTKTEDAKIKQSSVASISNEIARMKDDNDKAKTELAGKKVDKDRKEELELQVALTEKDILKKESELKVRTDEANNTTASAEVLTDFNSSGLKTELSQKSGKVKSKDVASNEPSTNNVVAKSTKEKKSEPVVASNTKEAKPKVDDQTSAVSEPKQRVEKQQSVAPKEADLKAARQDSMMTVMLKEFVITAQAYKKQYEEKKVKLDDVRIDASETDLASKYTDAESIITASQLEKGANESIAKVLENMRIAETEKDKQTKLDLLAEANRLSEQIIADQAKAIELYNRGRSSAALAQKPSQPKSNETGVVGLEKVESEVKPTVSVSDADFNELAQMATQNKVAYLDNKSKLDGISRANMEPDVVSLTNILVNDADVYFETAQGKRVEADNINDKSKKHEVLVQANDYEQISLKKQVQALEILKSKESMAQVVDKQLNNNGQYEVKKPDENKAVAQTEVKSVQEPKQEPKEVTPLITKDEKSLNNEANAKAIQLEAAKAKQLADADLKAKQKAEADAKAKILADAKAKQNADAAAKVKQLAADKANAKQLADAQAKEKNQANQLAKGKAKSEAKTDVKLAVADNKSIKVRTSSNVAELLDNESYQGVYYKVQVAAFKGDVRFGMFNGVAPISTENTPSGFTRVMAGVFTNFEEADKSKEVARQKGYKDAFVVGYFNGKRVKIVEAKSMKDSVKITASKINFNAPVVYAAEGVETIKLDPALILEKQKNVNQIKGLFYTVQVGVYSKPVLLENVYDLKDVYYEKLPNGQIRYYSGISMTKEEAIAAKPSIVSKGVKDAFVTAYKDGQRLSIAKAAELKK